MRPPLTRPPSHFKKRETTIFLWKTHAVSAWDRTRDACMAGEAVMLCTTAPRPLELLSQFSTCSGWRWLEGIGDREYNCHGLYCWKSCVKIEGMRNDALLYHASLKCRAPYNYFLWQLQWHSHEAWNLYLFHCVKCPAFCMYCVYCVLSSRDACRSCPQYHWKDLIHSLDVFCISLQWTGER